MQPDGGQAYQESSEAPGSALSEEEEASFMRSYASISNVEPPKTEGQVSALGGTTVSRHLKC